MGEISQNKLELNGMSCGSCEKIIERVVQRSGAKIESIDAGTGVVVLSCEQEKLDIIKHELAEKGFTEKSAQDFERGNAEHIFTYIDAIVNAKTVVEAEAVLINYSIAGLIASGLAVAILYMLFFGKEANAGLYVPLLVLAVISAVLTTYSYNNAKCYDKGISCTNGMMVGMILGMIPGFMIGAIIGATNGMFMGSVIGMITGIVVGLKTGKACGIMGAMEGAMAGFMAGIMGAMTSVMMFGDNLVLFLYIAFAMCGAMVFGMSYLLHREAGARDGTQVQVNMVKFAVISVLLSMLLVIVMFYGPKGPLTFT